MGVIIFLLLVVGIIFCVGGTIGFGQYLTYRKDARLEELAEVKKENKVLKFQVHTARRSLQKIAPGYSHNPQLEAQTCLDTLGSIELNELNQ